MVKTMRWIRKILSSEFIQEKEQFLPQQLNVMVASDWGILEKINPDGTGFIKFKNGGGQLIRNWDHFFELISVCETETI